MANSSVRRSISLSVCHKRAFCEAGDNITTTVVLTLFEGLLTPVSDDVQITVASRDFDP